jgi:hypothetical protein
MHDAFIMQQARDHDKAIWRFFYSLNDRHQGRRHNASKAEQR